MTDESKRLFSEACRIIPGGVNSPVRSWRAVGGQPLFIARGEGPHVFDADGHRYVDFVASWGPLILGHAPAAVVQAIERQAKLGTSFGAPTALEVEFASLLVNALPSVEQVRLVSSGTEATMSVLRLARAATGRDRVLKFVGCYHGHVDALLVRAGSGALTLGVPDSPGVPKAVADLTILADSRQLTAMRRIPSSRIWLGEARPNPLVVGTMLRFATEENLPIRLQIFGVDGRLVRSLVSKPSARGNHEVWWDGRDNTGFPVASGSYYTILEAGGERTSRPLLVIR